MCGCTVCVCAFSISNHVYLGYVEPVIHSVQIIFSTSESHFHAQLFSRTHNKCGAAGRLGAEPTKHLHPVFTTGYSNERDRRCIAIRLQVIGVQQFRPLDSG